MPELPSTHAPPLIRTDFTSDQVWDEIKADVERVTPEGFQAWIVFLEDRGLEGLGDDALAERMPRDYPSGYQHPVVFIVDRVTITDPERPILVISSYDEHPGRFRCLPSTVQAIQNNLTLANLDFVDFAGAVDGDGVFRGF
jgi:hypothetical protein